MKRLALAVLLGLVCGWGVSLFLRKSAPTPENRGVARSTPLSALTDPFSKAQCPPSPVADDPGSLDTQRAAVREGRAFSPYRDELFSMDLVRSLDGEALGEAFLAGQIRDEIEVGEMFARLGTTDPDRGLELLWEIPDRNRRQRAQSALVDAWAKRDAPGALARLAALPDTEFRQLLARDLADAWTRHDPSAAFARIGELSGLAGPFGELLAESQLKGWAERDYAAAEGWVLAQPESPRRTEMFDALLLGHAATLHGAEAVDFVLGRSDSPALQTRVTEIFQNWAMGEPAAAVRRFAAMPAGHPVWQEAEQLGRATAMHQLMLTRSPDAAPVLDLAQRLPEGGTRNDFLLGAANSFSSNNIPEARRVLEAMPESRQRADGTGMLAELWMRQDPVALSEWLATLDPAPSRDRGVGRFASLLAESDPERARQWAEMIADDRERAHVLQRLKEAPDER